MADYRIVCRNTEHPHSHISDVGTGISPGQYLDIWTVTEVVEAMKAGDTFHTISPSTGLRAEVRAYLCEIDGCKELTLRSVPDAVADNNLDNLNTCSVSGSL